MRKCGERDRPELLRKAAAYLEADRSLRRLLTNQLDKETVVNGSE